jgi:hypothetical protein
MEHYSPIDIGLAPNGEPNYLTNETKGYTGTDKQINSVIQILNHHLINVQLIKQKPNLLANLFTLNNHENIKNEMLIQKSLKMRPTAQVKHQ